MKVLEIYEIDERFKYTTTAEKNQYVLRRILYHIAKICDKYNLNYIIICGTLLGAIRNNDIIPWDLDADIYMDYESFVKLKDVADELPSDLFYQHRTTDVFFENDYYFARIVDLNSCVNPTSDRRISPNGIHCDIQCLDKRELMNKLLKKDSLYENIKSVFIETILVIVYFLNTLNLKKAFYQLSGYGIYMVVSRQANSRKRRKEKMPEHSELVCDYEYIYVTLKDFKVKAPKKYDEYLSILYGNYMESPNTEEIKKDLDKIKPDTPYDWCWLTRKLYGKK